MNFLLSILSPTAIKWVSILLIILTLVATVFISYNNKLHTEIKNIENQYKIKELEATIKLQQEYIKNTKIIETLTKQSTVEQKNNNKNIERKSENIQKTIDKNVDKPASKLFKDIFRELELNYGEKQ